ncbi:MAG: hypothetical protein ACXAAI_07125 [Promethearchaeota archaeon]|jgi:hypothetical protein
MRTTSETQLRKIKELIFQNGRLLERKLFSYFFENGNKDAVIKALVAYQNPDGGFGNGIEPDLLIPDSTAIGAETAMFYLDLLEFVDNEITDDLYSWIIKEQNEKGYITHPPKNMQDYPFQEWWDGPDDQRILTLSGFLKKWGLGDAEFFQRVNNFYSNNSLPEEIKLYDYPYYFYLKYLGENKEEKDLFHQIHTQLPDILEQNREHYLLFGRHWYPAIDNMEEVVIEKEVANFFNGLQDDGGLKIVYQNLPWWRPIWTLDGLILLKKSGLIEF